MALFPAYATTENDAGQGDTVTQDQSTSSFAFQRATPTSWLHNDSFVPSTSHETQDVTVLSSESSIECIDERPAVKKAKKRKKKKKHKHEKKTRKSVEVDKTKSPQLSKPTVQEKWSFLKSREFEYEAFTDRHREVDNFAYGGIYKRHVAKYRSLPVGLGPSTLLQLFKQQNGKNKKSTRYFTMVNPRIRTVATAFHVKKQKLQSSPVDLPSFIELYSEKTRDEEESEDNLVWDSTIQMYREVNKDKGKADEIEQSQNDDLINADLFTTVKQLNASDRARAINAALSDTQAQNVDLWMEYVNLQDTLYNTRQMASTSTESKSESERVSERSLCERKLAILDKAINQNSQNLALRLRRLEIGSLIWEPRELADEWRKLEFHHVNRPDMWRGLLSFSQQHFSAFTVENQLRTFDRCLSKFQSILDGKLLTHKPLPNSEHFALECFIRRCEFLSAAGYSEKAWANWQAAVEYNFFMPDHLRRSDADSRRMYFEPFWDSGAARFGEPGALGWAETLKLAKENKTVPKMSGDHEKNKNEALTSCEDEVFEQAKQDGDPGEGAMWHTLETLRITHHYWPWRRTDDADQEEPDDTEREALFDDIACSLTDLRTDDCRFMLLLALLRWLRVDVKMDIVFDRILHLDTLSTDVLAKFTELPNVSEIDSAIDLDAVIDRVFDSVHTLYVQHPDVQQVFLTAQIRNLCKRAQALNMPAAKRVVWFRNQVKALMQTRTGLQQSPYGYVQFAQRIIELDASHSDQALQIFHTTCLTSISSPNPHARWYALAAYADAMLKNVNTMLQLREAGQRLTAAVVGEQPNASRPSTMLLARKQATERLQKLVADGNSDASKADNLLPQLTDLSEYANVVCVQSCLQLCSTTETTTVTQLQSAIDIIVRANVWLRNVAGLSVDTIHKNCERLTEQNVMLHETYIRVCPTAAPRLLHGSLCTAVIEYPSNATIARKYVQYCVNRLRFFELQQHFNRVYARYASTNAPVVQCVSELYASFVRFIHTTNRRGAYDDVPSVQRIRTLFERTLQHHPNNALLWRLWLRFESLSSSTSKSRHHIERVMYTSIRHCPSSLALYMDCVQCLPLKFNMIYDLLIEKQLRVRLPVEELKLLRLNFGLDKTEDEDANSE